MALRGLTGFLLVIATLGIAIAGEPRLEFFPQELYLNEPATFGFVGKQGDLITITHQDQRVFSGTFSDTTLEASVIFRSPGTVTIAFGSTVYLFQLVGPDTTTPLSMKEGYLYTGNTPVILALTHNHPPKHDRTWEVLNILKKLSSSDELPIVKSMHLLSGSSALANLARNAGCSEASSLPPPPKGVNEIDHLITQRLGFEKSDLNVVVLSDRDLNLGLTQKRLRMRLEWLLQACHDKGPFMVTSISLSRSGRHHHGTVNHHIKLASLSNSAGYLAIPMETSETEVNSYILKQLQTKVNFK